MEQTLSRDSATIKPIHSPHKKFVKFRKIQICDFIVSNFMFIGDRFMSLQTQSAKMEFRELQFINEMRPN
jgi:hypothetical protein